MPVQIRKFILLTEEVLEEGGCPLPEPRRRAIAACVLKNPFAGHFEHDLAPLIEAGEALGAELAARALAALGTEADAYGKAAIVGEGGELEHAAALLHPKMGAPVRAALNGGAALIPSAKKRAGMGATIDIPLGHKDAAFVRSHFDAIELRVTDAPMAGEIVLALALAKGGRPWPRIGGLSAEEIEGHDGLR
ncbi:amino acid synthesis family protein [Rhodovarius crocodyli]|uniref:Amino acid synthesis family protein n=1 Tax=Rhodovarius crocodyli TaxID=1979269 RepID=A0A437LW43_9PROT|nr:amino acid synthesis family protein [Rhodovarius crocodyli]RVT89621.1 amino acid synthesis family protein [Rhodovarius crocodyli]